MFDRSLSSDFSMGSLPHYSPPSTMDWWPCSLIFKHSRLLSNQTWVHLPIHNEANLLILDCGEGKCRVYCKESWTIKKTEHQRIDAFKLWCWRRLLTVPWTVRRSNQSILKEVNPEYSLEGLMLKLQYFGHLMQRTDSLEKNLIPQCNSVWWWDIWGANRFSWGHEGEASMMELVCLYEEEARREFSIPLPHQNTAIG